MAALARHALGVVLALTVSGLAAAQSPNGIKMGEGRLHPFLDLELRYDSAAGFFGGTGNTQLMPEFVAHVRPGLRLDLVTSSVALNLVGNADYVGYTGWLTPSSRFATRVDGSALLDASFNRLGAVEFSLSDRFARSDRPNNVALGVGVVSLYNELIASMPIHPGGGAFEVAPRAAWGIEFYDPLLPGTELAPAPGCTDPTCDPSQLGQLNYNNFRFELDVRWRFLPKTALTFDSSYETRLYSGGAALLPPSLLNLGVGIAGLVSAKLAIVLRAGWAYDFNRSGANTVHGQAELNYIASQTANVRLGYLRSVTPVPIYGTYISDRGYTEGRVLLGGKLILRGLVGVDYVTFQAGPQRNDLILSLDVGPQYQFTPWLMGSIGYIGAGRTSSVVGTSLNFMRHEAYGRLTFSY